MEPNTKVVEPVETVGTSPKAVWGPLAAAVAALIARALGELLGVSFDSEAIEGLILAGIATIGGVIAARLAKPGKVRVAR